MGTFIISRIVGEAYVFNLRDDDGNIVLSGNSYMARGGCVNGVEAVQLNAQDRQRYKQRVAEDGQHYFVLTAANGREIGISTRYPDKQGCDEGMMAVIRAARGAEVYEKL